MAVPVKTTEEKEREERESKEALVNEYKTIASLIILAWTFIKISLVLLIKSFLIVKNLFLWAKLANSNIRPALFTLLSFFPLFGLCFWYAEDDERAGFYTGLSLLCLAVAAAVIGIFAWLERQGTLIKSGFWYYIKTGSHWLGFFLAIVLIFAYLRQILASPLYLAEYKKKLS